MATGDSQLSNSARLLAAQEFNRRQKEAEAAERLAEVEKERQEELARITRQKQAQIDNARNIVERQRAEEALKEQLAQKATQDRIAKVEAQAKIDREKALLRTIQTGGDIEVLTGRVAQRNTSGRIVGLTNQESKTATLAKQRIVREINRREVERTKVTDLERFLQNERALASGQVDKAELKRQIADRKKRGLSQTPQQKRLSQQLRDQELAGRLGARQTGKRAGVDAATFGQVTSERAKALGRSADFTNANFISARGGGRSFQARAGDNSLGQINSQIALLESKRTGKSAGQLQNERVALQIASGNFFSNLSNNQLLTITSGQSDPSKRRKAQSAKSQKQDGVFQQSNKTLGDEAQALNRASPFAIIAQQDIPDPTTGITDREVQLFREDIIQQNKSLPKDKQKRVPDTSEFFASGRAPRANDPFNDFTFGNFGGEDTTKIKERKQVDLGTSIFSDTQTQADIEASRKEASRSIFDTRIVSSLPKGVTRVTKAEQNRRDKRARGLRAQGISGSFQDTFSVRGSGIDLGIRSPLQQSQTKRGGSPVRQPQTFNVALTENIGLSDRQSTTKTKKKVQSKKPTPTTTPRNQTDSIFSLPTNQTQPRPTNQTQPRPTNQTQQSQGINLNLDFLGGVGGISGVLPSPFEADSFRVDTDDPILRQAVRESVTPLTDPLPDFVKNFFRG